MERIIGARKGVVSPFAAPPGAIRTGPELRAARDALRLTQAEMGAALGLRGDYFIRARAVRRMEKADAIPRHVGLLVECYLQGARPSSWSEPQRIIRD